MVSDLIAMTIPTALLGLAANALLLLGSFWLARHLLRQPRGLAEVLATAVIFWTACTLGLEILGAIGAISLGGVLAWCGVVFALGAIVRWRKGPVGRALSVREIGEPLSWDALASVALLLPAALYNATRSVLLGVKVVSDGPIYHLYFAARWWKAGRLFLVAAPFGENAATYFPANGDLWFTWLLASWGGDRFAKVGQAPFLLLAALAAYGCARALGAGRSSSLIATCWFACSTPVLLFSFEPNVDTIFVAGYLMAAYFFLQSFRGENSIAPLFLGSLSAGLALGTKAVAIVFIPPLIALVIGGIFLQRTSARTRLVRSIAVAVVPLVTGGFWFVRNALLTGNPLYPLDVRLGGQSLLHGWYGPDAMRLSPYYVAFGDWRSLCKNLEAVLDLRLIPLWFASLAGVWAINNPKIKSTRGWIAAFSLLAVANVALYWTFIPYRTQQRFMLQSAGLGVVPLAMTLDRARWVRHLAVFLLGIHLFVPIDWPFDARPGAISRVQTRADDSAASAPIPLIPRFRRISRTEGWLRAAQSDGFLLGTVVAAGLTVWAFRRVWESAAGRGRRAMLAVAATALFVWLGYLDVWRDGIDSRLEFYPIFLDYFIGWQNFDIHCGPTGSRVAYAGTNIPYYLLGRGLRNEVRYINIDRHRDWLLHDYHREAQSRGQGLWPNSRPGWDRMQPDSHAWLENLDAEGIQLLVVTRVNPGEGAHNVADAERFPIERRWADSHPERFKPLYGLAEKDPQFRIYRIRPPALDR